MTDAQSAETVAVASETPPPPAKTRVQAPGAVGVHISGVGCRATASISPDRVWVGSLMPGDVEPVVDSIIDAVLTVEPHPKFVVVGTPGHVNSELGTVTAAANLGQGWRGTVGLASCFDHASVAKSNCAMTPRQPSRANGVAVPSSHATMAH